jgi:hypothetical protein
MCAWFLEGMRNGEFYPTRPDCDKQILEDSIFVDPIYWPSIKTLAEETSGSVVEKREQNAAYDLLTKSFHGKSCKTFFDSKYVDFFKF